MSAETVFFIAFALLLILIAVEVPIGLALIGAGALGLILLHGTVYTGAVLGTVPLGDTSSYSLVLVPMFILMGMFIVNARIAEDVYAFAARVLRRVPGGLGYATLLGSAGFAAVTGSSVATVVTMGRIAISQMRRRGYPAGFAAALVASAGTLGILIPPSLVLVIYGALTEESIGALLLAGVIPGIIAIGLYGVVIFMWSVRHRRDLIDPTMPAQFGGEAAAPAEGAVTWRGMLGVLQIALVGAVVLGGIYTGWFTATESGAVAALVCLVLLIVASARKGLVTLIKEFTGALRESAGMTSMIFLLLVGGGVFTVFVVSAGIPAKLAESIAAMDAPPHLVLLVIIAILIPLGMFLDGFSILLLTVPLLYPVIIALGFDGVWFGIIMVIMIELGLITPPVGINVFAAAATAKVKVEQVFKAVWPFGVAMLALVALIVIFPQLALWLPSIAKG